MSTPSRKQKRTFDEGDLDEIICKNAECEMGNVHKHIETILKKNLEQEQAIGLRRENQELKEEVATLKIDVVNLNEEIVSLKENLSNWRSIMMKLKVIMKKGLNN